MSVVVIGNVGIDTNVTFPHGPMRWDVESNFTDDVDCIGQAGGYTSRGYARLGQPTAFVGYVGDDFMGRHIRDVFTNDGIDCRGLMVDPAGTNRSVNLMNPDGTRRNFYDAKGHMSLQPNLAVIRNILTGARLVHAHLPNWARQVLPLAKDAGAVIACDLQDTEDPGDPYRRDFIEAADILFCSSVNHDEPEPLIEALLGTGDKIVIAGMGARGCALGTSSGIRRFPPVDIPDHPVVDTNGAGDGLAVGFLTSYVLEGRDLAASIQRGQLTARWTCGLRADSSRLITAEQLDVFVAGL